ncbi:LLM class flavin-dependent oxidoreductase [Pseudonocardia sp. KRD291]|uniref:LLM class flavin-dependent oxidoreductase n=1 Tax=Pseudonocardia sp. KRD291 TaxID=2792007 RepID=UPI001C49F3F9|nr:LLM class flavin-dependent oxidoreductase [Pseudonocardia sp. KRD291]
MSQQRPLKFGVFVPPQNVVGLSPTLAIRRTIELAEHLDQLGFDEIWFGEHHSGGAELVASPELLIAAAAERTRRIRLGTGVISLPYHHPFQVADRIVQLTHMTRGRVMFGAGPGQLPTDATMFGLEATQLRPRMEEALDIILRLLAGETVSHKADWLTLQDAVLQLGPFRGELDVSVVGTVSPSGPKLAGRHGLGLLSLAATDPTGNDQLPVHWDIMNEEAARTGHTIDRSKWRLMGPMHVAESEAAAVEQCRYGLRWQYEYLSHISPSAIEVPETTEGLVEVLNGTGRASIGTPDMAAAQIQRLLDRSGGFGTYLFQGVDFANWRDTLRSYELFAEEVIPRFDGTLTPALKSYEHVLSKSDSNRSATAAARVAAGEQWKREREATAGS